MKEGVHWIGSVCVAGVTSFSIDLESKKVTVTGQVSPAGVLESISKVKKAELLVV
jgi:copper chaperone CopZ